MSHLCKSVRHFIVSEMLLSLNSTITQTGILYGICLGPFLCLKLIFSQFQ